MVVNQTKFWDAVKLENRSTLKQNKHFHLFISLCNTAFHSLGLHLPLHLQQIMYDLCVLSIDYQKTQNV